MFLLFRQLRVILFSKRKINTKLQMLRRILLLISYHNTQLNSSFRTYQDCKIRLVLEDTNTLFISEDLLQKLFYEAPEGEERERQFQSVVFFSSETIFKERFSTALFCSKEVCMDTETYECSVQFYHYEGLNFAYSAGLTFLTIFKLAPTESHLVSSFAFTDSTSASTHNTRTEKSLC